MQVKPQEKAKNEQSDQFHDVVDSLDSEEEHNEQPSSSQVKTPTVSGYSSPVISTEPQPSKSQSSSDKKKKLWGQLDKQNEQTVGKSSGYAMPDITPTSAKNTNSQLSKQSSETNPVKLRFTDRVSQKPKISQDTEEKQSYLQKKK